MLTRFQKCYQEGLAQNETLTKLITPKAFGSMADYEFFMVSSHTEELDTGTPSFFACWLALLFSHSDFSALTWSFLFFFFFFFFFSPTSFADIQKSLRTTTSCSRKLKAPSLELMAFPHLFTQPLLTPKRPGIRGRTRGPHFQFRSPRAPFPQSPRTAASRWQEATSKSGKESPFSPCSRNHRPHLHLSQPRALVRR